MAYKVRSLKWLAANTAWRRAGIEQIARWVAEEYGPKEFDERWRRIAIKRFARLETFLNVFFPDHGPAPFDPADAAALIVGRRGAALKLARKLFDGGPGIASDLQLEDLTWNLDLMHPREHGRPYRF
jgi:hypothetical protein